MGQKAEKGTLVSRGMEKIRGRRSSMAAEEFRVFRIGLEGKGAEVLHCHQIFSHRVL